MYFRQLHQTFVKGQHHVAGPQVFSGFPAVFGGNAGSSHNPRRSGKTRHTDIMHGRGCRPDIAPVKKRGDRILPAGFSKSNVPHRSVLILSSAEVRHGVIQLRGEGERREGMRYECEPRPLQPQAFRPFRHKNVPIGWTTRCCDGDHPRLMHDPNGASRYAETMRFGFVNTRTPCPARPAGIHSFRWGLPLYLRLSSGGASTLAAARAISAPARMIIPMPQYVQKSGTPANSRKLQSTAKGRKAYSKIATCDASAI